MTTIDRRTTAELITEHVTRVGRTGDTNYTARSKEFISYAHRHCATLFFHRELLTISSGSLSATAGQSWVDISSLDALVICNVDLKEPSGARIRSLTYQTPRAILGALETKTDGEPHKYTRTENSSATDSIHFEREPDRAFDLDVLYYKRPADLDDASGNLELAEEWDEVVLELSVAEAFTALWQPELADFHRARFERLAGELPNPILAEAGLPGEPIRSTGQTVGAPGGPTG